jgi:hypothetical protein
MLPAGSSVRSANMAFSNTIAGIKAFWEQLLKFTLNKATIRAKKGVVLLGGCRCVGDWESVC